MILLQIMRIMEHRVFHESKMLIMASCKLGQNLLRDQADPHAIWGLSSAEFLTTNCVLRSLEFRDFLKKALDKNPETRPSAAQLLEVGTSTSPRLVSDYCLDSSWHFSATETLQKRSAVFFPLEQTAEPLWTPSGIETAPAA